MVNSGSSASWPMVRLEATGETAENLAAQLQDMVNNPDFSDICFVCKDGVKVLASRLFLMARSDVLRSMLSNGMAESCMSEIELPAITSSALLPTLEFLYTGAVTKHAMELETAILVFHAANFFLIARLEDQVKEALAPHISVVSDSPKVLAHLLTTITSCHISGLLESMVHIIMIGLRRHCCAACPTTFLRHLSSEAMQMLLEFMKAKNPYAYVLSFMEYMRLRSLLLWGACHSSPEAEAEELLLSALPNEDTLAPHLNALKESDHKSYWQVGLQEPSMTELHNHVKKVEQFLWKYQSPKKELIDLSLINPVILIKVLKPLFSRSLKDGLYFQLEDAVDHQVVHAGEMGAMRWVVADGGEQYYMIKENGAVLWANQYDSEERPYAFVNMSFQKISGVYETKFVVENPSRQVMITVFGISGITSGRRPEAVGGIAWKDNVLQSVTKSTTKEGQFEFASLKYTRFKKGDQIRATVDMGKRCCSLFAGDVAAPPTRTRRTDSDGLSIDVGAKCDVQWGDDVPEVLLGALCRPHARLRVSLVSDNAFL